jgi:dipeptidyl aminopeptidase/acylaminoacyl peptidase
MRSVVTAASAAVGLLVASSAHAAPPPASAFGRAPAVVDAEISPNGQRIAILGGTSEQRVVSIATIDQAGMPMLQLGPVEGVGVQWAGDDHVLARIAFWEKEAPRYAYRFERNVVVNTQAKAVARLLDNDTFSRALVQQPVFRITGESPPQAMVMGLIERGEMANAWDTRLKRRDEDYVISLWRTDPATGKGAMIDRGNPDTYWWTVDATGRPRVRLDINQLTHRFSVHGRAAGEGQWKLAWDGKDFRSRRHYYGYSEATDSILLANSGRLMSRRLSDGAETPLGTDVPGFNPQVIWDEHKFAPVGIATGGERPNFEWLDPEIGAAHAVLARAFKSQVVWLWSWSRDRNRYLAFASTPSSPPVWYLYDRARKEISPIGEEYPELKGVPMGSTRWITYKARDGMDIPAYLTLPPGAAPGAKHPLVVLPHGGPATRDDYGFNYLVQFLATRGYAVLQPQYRGSWGFGDAFEFAGRGEWGGKMQTDLLDGIAAVARSGEIDDGRVCIVGVGFGGYLAQGGATLQSGAYRCAASFAGISDLGSYLNEKSRTYGREGAVMDELREEMGAASSSRLMDTSPYRQAAKAARTPILLVHGDQDTFISIEQSERMAGRLKSMNIEHEFLELKEENHFLVRSANRTLFLEALERFLGKHLPVN